MERDKKVPDIKQNKNDDFWLLLSVRRLRGDVQPPSSATYALYITTTFIINMRYNFDENLTRYGTACYKHDGVYRAFNLPAPTPQEWQNAKDEGRELLPMWVADMDFRTPYFIMNAIRQRAWHEVMGYTFGDDAYWTAVEWWLSQRYHIKAEQKELHYIPGIVAGIAFVLQAFTQPGDKVLVTTPVYPPFLRLPQDSHRETVCCPLTQKEGRFAIDPEVFRKAARGCKIFILSNPHNPGGTVWTKEELTQIAETCEQEHLLVISDEIHADLTLPGYVHSSYSTVCEAARQHSFTFVAPSKTFNIAGLSSSICYCANDALRRRFFHGYLDTFGVAEGTVFAYTAATAAFSPQGEEWLRQLTAYLQQNVEYMKGFMAQNLPKVKAMWPEASFMTWLDFSDYGMPHHQLRHTLLNEAHVALNDGTTFGGDSYGCHFRLNFGCPKAVLGEGLARIARVLG